jgi:16S rRNA (guanine527-N7)-methyltransferase
LSDKRFAELCAVAGPVSRETYADLERLAELLRRWSERINLVSPSTIGALWERHIVDSAQLFPYGGVAENWADLGSGGGFPGLVLAVLLKHSTGSRHIELVESNGKKAAFLLSAASALSLPAKVRVERIERHVKAFAPPEIVTARALASLPKLLELTSPWLSKGAKALFHKGREYRSEVEESRQHWIFDLLEHPSKVEADAAILEITNLRQRPDQ